MRLKRKHAKAASGRTRPAHVPVWRSGLCSLNRSPASRPGLRRAGHHQHQHQQHQNTWGGRQGAGHVIFEPLRRSTSSHHGQAGASFSASRQAHQEPSPQQQPQRRRRRRWQRWRHAGASPPWWFRVGFAGPSQRSRGGDEEWEDRRVGTAAPHAWWREGGGAAAGHRRARRGASLEWEDDDEEEDEDDGGWDEQRVGREGPGPGLGGARWWHSSSSSAQGRREGAGASSTRASSSASSGSSRWRSAKADM